MTTSPIKATHYHQQVGTPIMLCSVGKKYPAMRPKGSSLDDFWALRDVSLDVYQGEVLGIIGRNGAGKTTLLHIMTRVLSPTEGEVSSNGKALGLFNLGAGFQDELTGRENIFLNGALLGATKKELENKLGSMVEFSELGGFIDMPLGSYSQGMRLRLGFSIVINLEFDILVIDEVLAVGDVLFQNKCFQRLMDFRREGKTLVITSQSLDLIERLCDRVILLEHGKVLFQGGVVEGIDKYRLLLNTEKFFVGPLQSQMSLVENTKKWADDVSGWGRVLGTHEVIIKKIEFLNGLGWKCSMIKSGHPLKIKVYFSVRNKIKEPHFGIAIFRNDGVYCYGPNTKFDGHQISELKQGNGYFVLDYPKFLLAPGEYRASVAIWDKSETLAFNYHEGFYTLTIQGNHNTGNELLNIPFRFYPKNFKNSGKNTIDLTTLSDKWGKKMETEALKLESIKLLNNLNEEKDVFMTNKPVKLTVNFSGPVNCNKNSLFWLGIYRDDGIYCQGITQVLNRRKSYEIAFPKFSLLPGGYRISLGIWDSYEKRFIICHHAVYPFRMIFNREDHGTVYLEHNWKWGSIAK